MVNKTETPNQAKTLLHLRSKCTVEKERMDFQNLLDDKGISEFVGQFEDVGDMIEVYLKILNDILKEESNEIITSLKLPVIRNISTPHSYNKIFEQIKRGYPNLKSLTLIFEDYKYMSLIFSVSVNISFPNVESLKIIKDKITPIPISTRFQLKDRQLNLDDILDRFPNVKKMNLERATIIFEKSKQYLKLPIHRQSFDNLKILKTRFVNESTSHFLEMTPNLETLQFLFLDGEFCDKHLELCFLEPFKIKHLIISVIHQSHDFNFEQPVISLAMAAEKNLNFFDRELIPLFKNMESISFQTGKHGKNELLKLTFIKKSEEEDDTYEEKDGKKCIPSLEELIDSEIINPKRIVDEIIIPLKDINSIKFNVRDFDRVKLNRFIYIFNYLNWLKQL
nr:MAG: hypothetical protein [Porcellio scaber clopovirus]